MRYGIVERGCDAGWYCLIEDRIRNIDGVGFFPLRKMGKVEWRQTMLQGNISREGPCLLVRALPAGGWIKKLFKTGHWTVLAETST